ncbi:Blp family class II bacteriocin [Bacillus mycoides]|uniref:Blp family class II bacteriocin n=1 Tax=Bacillus mycoides TaxID=1405 RepID=UPI0036E4F212
MENLQMLTEKELMEIEAGGWWNSWGKCVAGTVGGAGTGGLGGAGIGSAVPGIGTAIGAGVGGVSGALTGAAASC